MSPNDLNVDLAEQVHLQREEATGGMKIARITGPEDVRNVQTQAHASGAQMIPFAESFNQSMTATAITSADFQRELPDGDAALQGNEGLKQSGGERPGMAHLFEEALAGIAAGSKKGLPNEGSGVSRSGGTSSGGEVALKDRLKDLVKEASAKVETSEVRLDGNEASQPSVAQQKDVSAADEGSAKTNNMPSVDAGLKEALMADLAQGMSQGKVDAPKEGRRSKETMKTGQEGVQRKASRKEEAVGAMATASAPEMPATTRADASVVTASPILGTSSLPMMPKGLPGAGDSSFAPTIGGPKSVREMTVKTQAAQKKNAPQESSSPSKTEVSSRQSVDPLLPEAATDAGKGETRTPEGAKKKGGANMESALPGKGHALSPENAFNVVSTETPIHSERLLISPPEKSAAIHIDTGDTPQVAGSPTTLLYGGDAHKMLAASPTTLEVGVPGGTHGWLKVRAELAGDGAVHASVSSSSLEGTEMLRRELPSLTSYLHQEQLQVSSVVVHASSSGMDGRDFAGGGQGHDPGQGATDAQGGARQESGTAHQAEGAIHSRTTETDEQDSPLAAVYAGGGGWLSIRA
jgi:hypothetical protein